MSISVHSSKQIICLALAILWLSGDASAQVLWTPGGVTVCSLPGPQELPVLVSDGSGGTVIVWADKRGATGYDVYAQRLAAQGNNLWTSGGVSVCTEAYDQYFPAVTPTEGGYIVAWQDVRNISGESDVYAQKLDVNGVKQWASGGVGVCTYIGNQYGVAVASDQAGGAYVAWRDSRNDPISGNTDIYLQRIGAGGSCLWPNAILLSKSGVEDRDVSIVADGVGGVIALWQDGRGALNSPSTSKDIYAQRVDMNGALIWGSNGLAICTAPGDQRFPSMISTSSGDIIVTWDDRRNGTTYGIYAQRVTANGTVLWSTNGVAVCALQNSNQVVPTISPDGFGGAFIAWTDAREGSSSKYYDIYAQRVTHNGTLVWDSQGLVVCAAPGWQGRIKSAEGAPGYVFFSWADNRRDPANLTYDYDIYAQKMDGSGVAKWQQNGVLVSNDQRKQELHQMVAVEGNAVIVWQDNLAETGRDIVAQKIGATQPDIVQVESISDGKYLQNGTWILLEGKLVSAVFGSCFYMQEPDRSSGIRVFAVGVAEGSCITVQGRLGVLNGERVLLDATVTNITVSASP